MIEVGIVGGGPGGLMAARHFKAKCTDRVRLTVIESTDRLGGKLLSRRFPESGVAYDAGVAEIYDYTALGADPLADLVAALGLKSRPIDSNTFVVGDRILDGLAALDLATRSEVEAFHRFCAETISTAEYYDGRGDAPALRALGRTNGLDLIHSRVQGDAARRFVRSAVHSDVAAPPHLTNALNVMRNVLMDVDGYIKLVKVQGGAQAITDALAAELARANAAEFVMDTRVSRVGRTDEGRYRVALRGPQGDAARDFDVLVVALPLSALAQLEWEGGLLDAAMARHVRYFDRPGHYLRVSVLFEKPFWRDRIKDDWWISDAFGGCCVYDESSRGDSGGAGILGWLVAGNAALEMANLDDATIVARVLDSLPADLRQGAATKREAAVHRWLSSVNALPGGAPERDLFTNHVPEPSRHPGLYLVGDYLFDSTINAVADSADAASDLALDAVVRLLPRRRKPARRIGPAHFADYRGLGEYVRARKRFLDAGTIVSLARSVWGLGERFSVLVAGSASGELVGELRAAGLDAVGIENNRAIHGRTPADLAAHNVCGDARDLPFEDGRFDLVYETCLAHVSDAGLADALAELRRVARRGLFFGSATAELALHHAGRYDLVDGVPRLRACWEWSEHLRDAGFVPAVGDPAKLASLWQAVLAAGFGPDTWFDDIDSLRLCFQSKEG
ncbi:MAG: FAD-dependent oxidoreductase [Rhodospirillales bacterium]|nr:FAD-dependent oxidoreductase [Rhodospirillales bacterium]